MAWCSVEEKHRDNFTFTLPQDGQAYVGSEEVALFYWKPKKPCLKNVTYNIFAVQVYIT
jgi:hypothetical protein